MDLVTQFFLSVLGGAIGAGVATWFAFRRFRSERWWDAKANAYQNVIDTISDILDITDTWSNDNNAPTQIDAEQESQLANRLTTCASELFKLKHTWRIYLSNSSYKIITSYMNAVYSHKDRLCDGVFFRLAAVASAECLDKLTTEARRDLRV